MYSLFVLGWYDVDKVMGWWRLHEGFPGIDAMMKCFASRYTFDQSEMVNIVRLIVLAWYLFTILYAVIHTVAFDIQVKRMLAPTKGGRS